MKMVQRSALPNSFVGRSPAATIIVPMPDLPTVRCESTAPVTIVTIDRPAARNAVNPPTAAALADAFRRFDADASQHVAILTGADGTFCAGYDLKQTAAGHRGHRLESGDGPMGPTRLMLGKPVIAAVEGFAVAGGLELALWCDLRVAARDATFGVYCRRFGVPLMDLGTIRLPRLIGQSRAMDMILTGRGVSARKPNGSGSPTVSSSPARRSPQRCASRTNLHASRRLPCATTGVRPSSNGPSIGTRATLNEFRLGIATVATGETEAGARRFAAGVGRHGKPV